MITASQFVQEWGADGLLRFPQRVLEGVDIPEAAKAFLFEAGLPRRALLSYSFTFSPLPVEPEEPPRGGMKYPLLFLYPQSRCRLLSHWQADDPWYYSNGVMAYGYNAIEEETGRIWWVEEGEGPRELLHSSIAQYAEAMLAYRDYIRHFDPPYPDPENKTALLQELERRLLKSDPFAMDDPPAIENLYALWAVADLPPEAMSRAMSRLTSEEIPALRGGAQRFWPRSLVDMEIFV